MSDSGSLGDGGKLLFCSFCGKNQNEVRRLIAGHLFTFVMSALTCVTISFQKSHRQ